MLARYTVLTNRRDTLETSQFTVEHLGSLLQVMTSAREGHKRETLLYKQNLG